jgi:hypothetical protein
MNKQTALKWLKSVLRAVSSISDGLGRACLFIVACFAHVIVLREVIIVWEQSVNYDVNTTRKVAIVFLISLLYIAYKLFVRDFIMFMVAGIKAWKENKHGRPQDPGTVG